MQICALDKNDSLIFAHQAVKHLDYLCLECKEPVRLRSGTQRKAHFYHSRPNGACHQHAKGMPHIMLQYFLKDHLPDGEVELECRFEGIGRVADVAWHANKMIFEIQYSPIRPEEVLERNHSYASIGYQVVWILHDARYNKHRLSPAEIALLNHPHYYSNINEEGEGVVYDQLSLIDKGRRYMRISRMEVDPAQPKSYPAEKERELTHENFPIALQSRLKRWPVGLAGDTLFRYIDYLFDASSSSEYAEQFDYLRRITEVKVKDKIIQTIKNGYIRYFSIPYQSILKLILERACR